MADDLGDGLAHFPLGCPELVPGESEVPVDGLGEEEGD